MIGFSKQRLVGKFAALFGAAGLVVAVISFFTLQQILAPTFDTIEQQVNREQVARARNALSEIDANLRASVLDYAVWDDVYVYAGNPTDEFAAEIYTPLGYENLGVDYMGVIRFDGTVVWSQADNAEGTAFLPGETAVLTQLILSKQIFDSARTSNHFGTYVRGSRGIYAIQTAWIKRTDGSGKPFAFHVLGQLLDEETLTNALQVKSQLGLTIPPQLKQEILRSPDKTSTQVGADTIRNSLGLVGHDGNLLATVSFTTPRTVSQTGAGAVKSAMAAMALSLLALAVLLALGINRIAVMRLQNLRRYVASFRTGRRVIDSKLLASQDEIGALAKQFDQLADELAEAEEELRRNSYVQGKADSAVGLLHNVRNALVPLQTKHDKWEQEDRQPLRGQLSQALDELAGDACPAERRAALETFARTASRKLIEQGATRGEEIVDIKHSVDQILAILSDYHFDSSAKPTVEAVDVEALLRREAVNLEAATGVPISLILPGAIPPVRANHIHLTQIITNVMINASEAMKAGGAPDWKVTVACSEDPATGIVEIAITDNGEGANAEVLAHAFERGFSTRKDKSSGMGLHWSSNTMRAMGGELMLESPGPGQGATVRLRLPLARQTETALAT
jgi:two-component system OmpR family sensor kinase